MTPSTTRGHIRSLILALLTLVPAALGAQEPVRVAELLRDADGDGGADRVGRAVTVVGTITAAPGAIGGERRAVLQDSTGGVPLTARDAAILPADLAVGERVEVRGRLRVQQGAERLAVTRVRRLGRGVLPEPRHVLARELAAGSHRGELVRIVGELVVPADILRTHEGLALKDRSGTIPVRTPERLFADRAFVRELLAARSVELVGIASRSAAGYELAPRQTDDFVLVSEPPLVKLGAGALVLSLLGLTFYFWMQRRRAEKWAGQMALLSENLRDSREALRKSEERYALAADGANDGLWDWDLLRDTIHFSPRWKQMLGYGADEIGNDWHEWLDRVHPDDVEELQAEIAGHMEGRTSHLESEHRMRHRDGEYRWMLTRGLAVRSESGTVYRIAGSQTDIHSRKLAEQQILHAAGHDTLTGLPNRPFVLDLIRRSIARAKRHPDYRFAVLFLDFDRFKLINDSLGHVVGDEFLVAIARRLQACVRPEDTSARLGGDEFVVLLDGIGGLTDATRVADRIQEAVGQAFPLAGHEVFTSASIGIVLSTNGYDEPEELLRDADLAMYRAKARGKARYEIFDVDMHAAAMVRIRLEHDLRKALERGEFRTYYQPILAALDGRVVGFEALVRWQHPTLGLLEPTSFVPTAEDTGLIVGLGEWVLRDACIQTREWQDRFPGIPPLTINVNISGKQLLVPGLARTVDEILNETGLDAASLKLELTENVLVEHTEMLDAVLLQLRKRGVELQMDDFGTGYSSLSYLHRFPISTMKIHRSFIERMSHEEEGREIVKTIITLAHNLRMQVIAEGVETQEQYDQLRALRCDYVQGFLFADPMPASLAESLLSPELVPCG
jgi:diguanylate cyclase (GGDEF)-like protein/PAS domain S-box-containing protein